MSEEIKINRPVAQQASSRQEYSQPTAMESKEPVRRAKQSKMPWVILGVVVLVLIVCGVIFRDKLFKSNSNSAMSGQASGYQAVFLTNGQVYFGRLSNANADYITLNDIYYLQVVQPPLQGQQQPGQATSTQQPQISLIKLGNELHGPVDEMHISRAQVLFYEDLKSDGQVVKAIEQDKASKK